MNNMDWKVGMLSVALLGLVSCGNDSESKLGKYVFQDDIAVIHVDGNCSNLLEGNRDGHRTYAKHPIDTLDLISLGRLCSKCVDEECIEHLKNCCERNIDARRRWVYDELVKLDYDMGEYDQFVDNISILKNRKSLYYTMQEEGYGYNGYEEFAKQLGFDN